MSEIEARLRKAGIALPEIANPAGIYVPAIRFGGFVYTSGQLPLVDGVLMEQGGKGKVNEINQAQAAMAARVAALNALAAVKGAVGDLDVVEKVLKLTVFVEIADSEEKRKRGLMWRKSLDKNSGMLFIYKDSRIRYFWMKNTYISLDIAFIDTNLVIKTIHTIEKTDDSTTLYSSYVPVQYVLEVNSGWLEQHNIHTGDTVTFDFNLSTP